MSSESNGTVAAPSDRTARAVATQVRTMACTSYEIGVRNAVQGQTLLRTWTVSKLEHSIPCLKRVNAQRQFDVQAAELSQQGIKVRALVLNAAVR